MDTKSSHGFWRATQEVECPAQDVACFAYTPPPEACVGPADNQFYMGGVGMATVIDALECHFEKPLLWATTQFLRHGKLGDACRIAIERAGGGRNVIQATAEMTTEDALIHRTIAALGARGDEPDRQFVAMPDTAPPEDCPIKPPDTFGNDANLLGQFERRMAFSDEAAGIEYVWTRPKFATDINAAYLALLSDFFLGAHSRSRGGTSLDNSLRICGAAETEWVLTTTQIAAFKNGAMQGAQYQFAQNGVLLSSSSQTGLLPATPNPLQPVQ